VEPLEDPPTRTALRPPVDTDGLRTAIAGTVIWLLAFVGLLPFYGSLEETGHLWWMWTCMAGVGLGLFGIEITHKRARARSTPRRRGKRVG